MCESQHVAVKMYINYSFFTFVGINVRPTLVAMATKIWQF